MKPNIIGINRRYYPVEFGCPGTDRTAEKLSDQSMDPPPTVAVLVLGEIEDYACYMGHGTPEWVAQFGNKIRFEEAKCHFPSLEKKRYRD